MSTERLRGAAKVLREVAQAATPGPWDASQMPAECGEESMGIQSLRGFSVINDAPPFGNTTASYAKSEDATFIATMHPGVALALADVLDGAASRWESSIIHGGSERAAWSHQRQHIAVADAILGDDQ